MGVNGNAWATGGGVQVGNGLRHIRNSPSSGINANEWLAPKTLITLEDAEPGALPGLDGSKLAGFKFP
jgi:hypothetical protein